MTNKTVGFHFQVIPLQSAINLVLAGDGNYSDIKAALLEKLPALKDDEAFTFGLPDKKEIDEDTRRGICLALNSTMKRAGYNWRVAYSSSNHLFVVVPTGTKGVPLRRAYGSRSVPNETKGRRKKASDYEATITNLMETAKSIFKVSPTDRKGPGKKARKAVCVVGMKDMSIPARFLAQALKLTPGGVKYNATHLGYGADEVARLRRAIKS